AALRIIWTCSPIAGAACCTSRKVVSATEALVGFTSTAIRTAFGTKSCRSRNRLAANSELKKLMPVALPPGRARLATRPSRIGSAVILKTIGIVEVAALAARALAVEPRAPRRKCQGALCSPPNARAIRQRSSFLRGHRPQISNEIVKVTIGHSRIKWEAHRRLKLGPVFALAPRDGALDLRIGPGANALLLVRG